MLSKSLIQFSVDEWSCVPSLLFTWGHTMVEVMKIMVISFERSQVCTATLTASNHTADHPSTHASTGDSWTLTASLGQSLMGSLFLSSRSWCTQGSVCALQESLSRSCVLSDSSVMGLTATSYKRTYYTQVCCAQSRCPCGSPLLTHTSTGDAQHSSVSVSVEPLGPVCA